MTLKESESPLQRLSRQIAATVRQWLDSKTPLPAYGRPVEPGDILILVRSRAPLVPLLLAALRQRGIPVSGVDRLRLSASLPVQDLLACARFALQPRDDLTLACLLKTPLVGLNDDDLITLAPGRKGTLWAALLAHPDYQDITDWLQQVITHAQEESCFSFFSGLLQRPCPADPEGTGSHAIEKRLGTEARDPLEELLEFALETDRDPTRTLAHLMADLSRDDPEIKRELSDPGNVVRMMTIHGAKGLEAPIVILADTMTHRISPRAETIFWPEGRRGGLPLWSPRQEGRPKVLETIAWQIAEDDRDEYRRLLYVALTRACDWLIVAGAWKGSRAPDENSWYFDVRRGFEGLQDHPGFKKRDAQDGEIWTLETPQTTPPNGKTFGPAPDQRDSEHRKTDVALDPLWRLAPPKEPTPPRPLRPLRPSEAEDPPALSPLSLTEDPYRFRRGLVTHKLLQILPLLPPDHREEAALTYAARARHDLPGPVQKDLVAEVLRLLSHPDFADVFGPGSQAEVPLTGLLPGGRVVSGQIDRLIVKPDRILVVDFKTNRPPPATVEGVPPAYLRQLAAYRDILKAIWPDRKIACALIWTDGARLMTIPDARLDSVPSASGT